jgi:hypothetical protein
MDIFTHSSNIQTVYSFTQSLAIMVEFNWLVRKLMLLVNEYLRMGKKKGQKQRVANGNSNASV